MEINIITHINSHWANYKPCTLSVIAFRDSFLFRAVDMLLCLSKIISTLAINGLHQVRLRFYVSSFSLTTTYLVKELHKYKKFFNKKIVIYYNFNY